METITKYKNLIEIPNFESDTLSLLPSFRGFLISALEQAQKCFDEIPKTLPFTGEDTVAKVIRRKLSYLPPIYPVDNCLIANKVKRPRFRHPTLDF